MKMVKIQNLTVTESVATWTGTTSAGDVKDYTMRYSDRHNGWVLRDAAGKSQMGFANALGTGEVQRYGMNAVLTALWQASGGEDEVPLMVNEPQTVPEYLAEIGRKGGRKSRVDPATLNRCPRCGSLRAKGKPCKRCARLGLE